MTQRELEFAKDMGVTLYKVRDDASKVAPDLDEIAYALIEAANMPSSAAAIRTIVRALAVQIVDAATKVEGIKDIVDETMSMPEAEQEDAE